MNKIIKIVGVSKKFNTIKGEIEALKSISFDINEGEFIAIVGNSGCGKSTLLSIIAMLDNCTNGNVYYGISKPIIGYMLQEDALFDHLTVLQNVELGLKVLGKCSEDNKQFVFDLLKKYNLYDYKDKYPKELSGGMRQRVALIRTLAIKPDILLLDEPFSALDYTTRLSVADDVYRIIKNYGKTTIIVTHDIEEAISMADRVIILSKSPATVKKIIDIELDSEDVPSKKRNNISFSRYREEILKELDVIV